jgi:ATP-dependent Clp protease protease subunit
MAGNLNCGGCVRALNENDDASRYGVAQIFAEAGRLLNLAKPPGEERSGVRPSGGYSVRAAGDTGEIVLYDDIGEGFWGGGISAAQFKDDLNGLGPVSLINVRINSAGGQVFEGLTMYNLLAQHKARVVTHIDGLAASIASVVAMSGDEIRIADNAMMMIHNAAGMCAGTSEQMRATADLLDTVTSTIRSTYCKQCGQPADKIAQLMADETWLNAADAKKLGLVDRVVDSMDVTARIDPRRFQFKNAPPALLLPVNNAGQRPIVERYAARLQAIRVSQIQARMSR